MNSINEHRIFCSFLEVCQYLLCRVIDKQKSHKADGSL